VGAEADHGDVELGPEHGLLACRRVDLDHAQLDARTRGAERGQRGEQWLAERGRDHAQAQRPEHACFGLLGGLSGTLGGSDEPAAFVGEGTGGLGQRDPAGVPRPPRAGLVELLADLLNSTWVVGEGDVRSPVQGGTACEPAWHACYGRRVTRSISQRELRNASGEIMRALDRGESFVVTRNGVPVGELAPLRPRRFVDVDAVLAAFTGAPRVNHDALRHDLDALLDQDTTPRA